jgi:hypothetical protein
LEETLKFLRKFLIEDNGSTLLILGSIIALIIVGIGSVYVWGDNNAVEKEAEEILDHVLDAELNLPPGTTQIHLSKPDEEKKQ